ncbi:MAG TPA: FAD-dependent monooxygenase [Devosiaceae bacterium]|nr:FAD-dependent monooxygenase [Devosiaceae bacterium]
MSESRFDAAVIGGGLAGRAAAITVARAGLHTVHLAPAGPLDRRTSALMMPTVAYLQEIGVVADPAATGQPLRQIRIIDATGRLIRAPETLFDSRDAGLDAFGWNFPNVALAAALETVAAGLANLTTLPKAVSSMQFGDDGARLTLGDGAIIEAALSVGADGKNSLVRGAAGIPVREHKFDQAALVCDLQLGRPLDGQSVEFHYNQGPFTLVPAGGTRANLVWIDERSRLEQVKDGGPEALPAALRAQSMGLFGEIVPLTPAFIFPLSTLAVAKAGGNGVVLVGEAAHAFPPIGAQGLNLGLRDVADLGAALAGVKADEEGWARQASEDYARRRAGDLTRTGATVDALFRSLLAEMLPAQVLRAGGLWALKLLPGLRRQATKIGLGGR